MKKLFIFILAIAGFLFQACDATNGGDEYEITNPIPPYVELSVKTNLEVTEDTTINIPVRLRTGVQKDVTIQYEITGALTASGTGTIPRNTLQANIPINIPKGIVPGGDTTASATFTLKSATMETQALTIGHKGAAAEVRTLSITK